MEFDEIMVKESPGLCRCCLSEGCYKDMGSEYNWMNETEVYADMLLECFDISISQHNEGPNGVNRLICEVCITRLRDACNFKRQVLDSEKKFVDMIGRGEFRPKVLIYQADMKAEGVEIPTEEAEIEFLEDEMDYGEELETNEPEATVSDITVSTLPVKNKRGRPKKTSTVVKAEKKVKVAKMEEKAKSNKSFIKETLAPKANKIRTPTQQEWHKLAVRRFMEAVLKHSTIIPFRWRGNKYVCFYCYQTFLEASKLQAHTKINHKDVAILKHLAVNTNMSPTKIDVSELTCTKCAMPLTSFEELLQHLQNHKIIDDLLDNCFLPFYLKDVSLPCLKCPKTFNFFGSLYSHVNKEHLEGTKRICETCGQNFFSEFSLRKHVKTYHLKSEYKCTHCNLTFNVDANRISHEFKEHNIKIYNCYKCNEMFGSHYLRKLHLSTVHSAGKFSCEKCEKTFVHRCLLTKHFRRVHLKEKTHECLLCGERFFDQRLLKLHHDRHARQKVFQCKICLNVFSSRNILDTHMRVHGNKS